ncbi:uncharacterized protein LOC123446353 [Hordeum vulgare subsp. vulgare]|uniref:Predicted protein n=1 Tax=Hordeum vulgare subsp. vulgare TaxID=112509 RepID=F2D765_HORVV|nr:uncharacterized protein LOC123446353 [Hordeum vulgare subsp. vulgare]BAJ90936.1 predicted protein [Hordeum vulgare subsp. vulgare]
MPMKRSSISSCLMSTSGNRGARSRVFSGSCVLGCSIGGGFTDRSAMRLYHCFGTPTLPGYDPTVAAKLLRPLAATTLFFKQIQRMLTHGRRCCFGELLRPRA